MMTPCHQAVWICRLEYSTKYAHTIMELKTKQVDFTLTFVQATLEPGTSIEMLKLFEFDEKVLELKRRH